MTFRGDPFMPPQDTADPWDQRLDLLRRRCHRPWVAVRGEDLRLLVDQLEIWQRQAWSQAAEAAALREELGRAERRIAELTPNLMSEAA